MGSDNWFGLIASVAHVALGVAVLRRGRANVLAWPMALLAFDLAVWNATDVAGALSQYRGWDWVDYVASSVTVPITFNFIVRFVGRDRPLELYLIGISIYFGGIAGVCGAAFFVPSLADFGGSMTWAWLLLAGVVPTFACGAGALVRHHFRAQVREERALTRLVFVALIVLSTLGATDLWRIAGVNMIRTGHWGTLITTALLAVVAARYRLLGRRLSLTDNLNGLAAASIGAVAYVAIYSLFEARLALFLSGALTLVFSLAFAARIFVANAAAQRRQLETLASIGRFSSQLAHDIRNPLAAIKGAAQFLEQEHRDGRLNDEHADYVTLIGDQANRMISVFEHYRRLGRVELAPQPLQLNDLLDRALAAHALGAPEGVDIDRALAEDLPLCQGDPDLLMTGIENLLRNAVEAMDEGGTLTVATSVRPHGKSRDVLVTIRDTGRGMNARIAERALDEFFTTKAHGTGLGLSFVRRVIDLHQGTMTFASVEGQGTEVQLCLPAM